MDVVLTDIKKRRKKFYWFTGGSVFLIIIIVLNFFPEPEFNSIEEELEFEISSGQFQKAEKTLLKMIENDSTNLDLHYDFITNHFSISSNREGISNSDSLYNFYRNYRESKNIRLSEIGLYAHGLINSYERNYKKAISIFNQISNHKLPYLNNSTGYAFWQLDSLAKAESYFKTEIANNGNLSGAYPNLILLLNEKQDLRQLDSLLRDEKASTYFPLYIKEQQYFADLNVLKYVKTILQRHGDIQLWGFIAAILILVSWATFLVKIDVFEREKFYYPVITVVAGMAFSFLVYPISDFLNYTLGFDLTGGVINDFAYCTIGIGMVEELVKILPLLLLIKYTKQVNEPYDYIMYGSLSALGFAFAENLVYFTGDNIHIIHGRALLAAVVHMFATSIIAYGIIISRFRVEKNIYQQFLKYFVIASLVHGFYDFWIINPVVNGLSMISYATALVGIYCFHIFKNNAINLSAYFDENKVPDNIKLHNLLFLTLTGILMFEFISMALRWSPTYASDELLNSIYNGTFLIVFISGVLSDFRLNKGFWQPVTFTFRKKKKTEVEVELND